MKKLNNKKGFTLMEMLIVVAIIAILIAIAIPTFSNSLTSSKQAADAANVRAAYSTATSYYMLNNVDCYSSAGEMQADSKAETIGSMTVVASGSTGENWWTKGQNVCVQISGGTASIVRATSGTGTNAG